MKWLTFTIVVLVSCISVLTALECYSCRNCPVDFKDDRTGPVTEQCPREDPTVKVKLARCSKHVERDGKINRGCSLEPECTTREIISKCSHEWNMENTHACEICCEGDRCNSATMATVSPALFLTVGALLGLYYA
ncbi:uncharacterized protein [Asterias amurensis]|uniref:uncharacterized protein n=1 Tax=Asterias amurensis TaxID=7602 RepID=UPI003AB74F5A